jgi:catechol 2,3-dioxygenase-like lactoylglutathione lyase family enzyme
MRVQREEAMKKLISALWLFSSLTAGAAWAQPYAPNEAGVTMGPWHLNSRDVEANKKIFLGMGGTEGGPGPLQRVIFPGVVVILNQQAGAPPATGGTVGSVVNHVGFIVQNVQESVAKWKAAGIPVQPGNNGRLDQAYVTTPDGLRIEILENKNQNVPIRHEHVHDVGRTGRVSPVHLLTPALGRKSSRQKRAGWRSLGLNSGVGLTAFRSSDSMPP